MPDHKHSIPEGQAVGSEDQVSINYSILLNSGFQPYLSRGTAEGIFVYHEGKSLSEFKKSVGKQKYRGTPESSIEHRLKTTALHIDSHCYNFGSCLLSLAIKIF